MRKISLFGIGVLALICTIAGCEDPIPDPFDANAPFEVNLVDTLTLVMATEFVDSLATDAPQRLLIGRLDHPVLGPIRATPFFQMALGDVILTPLSDDVFDSLALVIYPNETEGLGSGPDQRIELYQVAEDFETDNDSYYQFDSLVFGRTPLASFDMKQEEDPGDSLFIKVQTRLGRAIFAAASNGEDALSDEEEFRDFLRGFVLVSTDPQGNFINGIPASPDRVKLKLFSSRESGNGREVLEHEFPLSSAQNYFNRIEILDESSRLGQVKSSAVLETELTNRQAFVQGGTAVVTTIRLPSLSQLNEAYENFTINSAILEVKPIKNSFDRDLPLPASLTAQYINRFNRLNSVVLIDDEDFTASGDLIEDLEFEADTRYEIDIRNFIADMLQDGQFDDEHIVLTLDPAIVNSNVQALVIDASKFSTRLRLLISNYNE